MSGPLWFTNGPYPLRVAFVPNAKAWRKLMKQIKVKGEPYPTDDGRVTTFYGTDEGTVCALTIGDQIDKRRDNLSVAALIAHEVQHIWQHAQEAMQEKKPGTEYEAYTVQWLLGEALARFEFSRFKLFKD